MVSLVEKKAQFTQSLIVDAAIELIESEQGIDLSLRRIASQAGISERTMYRHFSSRNDLLDCLALKLIEKLELPSPPESIAELRLFANDLFTQLDKQPDLVLFTLDSEIFPRIQSSNSKLRLEAIEGVLKSSVAGVKEGEIAMVATNIRFVLSASSWRYYRYYFGFSLEKSIAHAERMVADALAQLPNAEEC